MNMLAGILAGVAALAWLAALVSFVALLGHRAPGVGRWHLLTSGYRSLQARSYRPSGLPWLRRLRWAMVLFLAITVAIALLGVLGLDGDAPVSKLTP